MAERSNLEKAVRRMGEPSWLILSVLTTDNPLHRQAIIKGIEQLYKDSNYPIRTVDPSTVTHALRRMVEDDIAEVADIMNVEIPAARGKTRWEQQPRYTKTSLGQQIYIAHQRLYVAAFNLGTK